MACKSFPLFCVFLFMVLVKVSKSEDLIVGTTLNNSLAFTETVQLSAIPLKTRTKNVFYNSESSTIIKGISCIDVNKSSARAIITSGGVGSTFVNIRLKSDRGDGLDYNVQIYV